MTWPQPDADGFHRVRIRNSTDQPLGSNTVVEIDGVPDKTITHVKVDVPAAGVSTVTLTILASVDIDVPAEFIRVPVDPTTGQPT